MKRYFNVAIFILWAVGLAAVCGAELYSENIVGIQAVDCEGTNVVLAVPFVATEGGDISISNLLSTVGLVSDDRLFRQEGKGYERWKLAGSPSRWTAEKVFTVGMGGTQEGKESSMAADKRTVGVGTGLWLTRTKVTPTRLFLVGTVTNEIPVVSIPGKSSRLVANPLETGKSPKIANAAEGDTIQIPTSAGPLRTYRYRSASKQWVCCENGTSKAEKDPPLIPPGTGFWYVSTGGEVKMSWE